MSRPDGTRSTSRTRTRVFVVAAALALTTAACSTDTGSGTGGGGSAGGDALVYWSMWKDGEPQQKVLQQAIDKFTKATGTKVEVQWQGRDVLKKLVPTLQTDNVPDLVDQEAAPVQSSLVSLQSARDLTDAYTEAIPDEGDATVGSVIPKRYLPLMSGPDGKPFMVPYELISSAMWFDAASLPDVAKSPPTTWDEFSAFCAKRKAAGKYPIAEDGDIGFYNSYWTVWGLIRALGDGNVNALVADKTGASWDDPRVLDVGKKIESLVKNGYFIPGYNGSKYPTIQQKWANGAADLLFIGTWAPSETGPYQKPGFQIDSFQFPNFPGSAPGNGSAETGMLGFAVPTQAKHYDAAKKFMAFFLAKENLQGIATTAENLTPRDDIEVPKTLTSVQTAIKNATSVHRPYDGIDADFPNYTPTVFEPVNNELLFGKISAAEWVSQLKAKTIDYWKQNG